MTSLQEHERWMARALELAEMGRGRVEPNPPVGAVIVRNGKLVAEGRHELFGGPHAEINALHTAGDAQGATLYVTLAPCTGLKKKTPPCCDAVIRAGFKTVVIGALDPTQADAVERLREAGIEVITGVLRKGCERMIAPFLTLKRLGRPYVIAKWAMTADGKIATSTGDARWISSEVSRELVHRWRCQVDAILIGAGTAQRDDPELTCRLPDGRNPARIVLDSRASLSLTSRLVRTIERAPLCVACREDAPEEARRKLSEAGCTVTPLPPDGVRVDGAALLRTLGAQQCTNLIVEGGSDVLGYFLSRDLVDEVRIFIAPKLIGGRAAPSPLGGEGIPLMAHALRLREARWMPVGEDMLLTGALHDAPH